MKGVGYFLHFHPEYIEFDRKFEECGGVSDAYEVLPLHFANEVESLKRYVEWKKKPFALHTAVMNLGLNGSKPVPLKMLQDQVEAIKPFSITEHHALLRGTEGDDFGLFFAPPELPEQKQIIVDNLKEVDAKLDSQILVENPIFTYDLNNIQTQRRVEFFNDTVRESGCGMHLSLSNISYSRTYGGNLDPDEYLASIDLSLVEQIHIYVNNYEQMKIAPKAYEEAEKWMNGALEQLLKHNKIKPFIFYELEARTPKLAEPERLRDAMAWARDLVT
jgi:uncharacterized protein (UPF0276 family)